jgi:phage portal protein BeeE
MSIMDGFRDGFDWLIGRENIQTRETFPDDSLGDLIARLSPQSVNPWIRRTVAEAMSVPAVFRAVSLISNTTGSLSLEAYRNGGKLSDDDTPAIVKRPNPFTTPQVFWRDGSGYMAQSGEAWWWTAKRDIDGVAMSLIPIDPRQIIVTENPKNLLRPFIDWNGVRMPNDDMTQVTLQRDPRNPLRGWGPLQACGAAVSVAVRLGKLPEFAGKTIVTVLPDAAERYLSTTLFEGMFDE